MLENRNMTEADVRSALETVYNSGGSVADKSNEEIFATATALGWEPAGTGEFKVLSDLDETEFHVSARGSIVPSVILFLLTAAGAYYCFTTIFNI